MNRVLELFGKSADDEQTDWSRVVEEQLCPYLGSACTKTRKSQPEVAIGTCCVSYGREERTLVICPNRLLKAGKVILDCTRHLRSYAPSDDLHVVPEVAVPGGSVDYFLVSLRGGSVSDFVGIELQALDTTGTVWPARQRFLSQTGLGGNDEGGVGNRRYGMNWKMTAKTTLMQLHHKVRTFEALGHRLVLVLQDEFLGYLRTEFAFGHVGAASDDDPMQFHAYKVRHGSQAGGGLQLVERLSTDTAGVRQCLDLQADERVDTGQLLGQLRRKLGPSTLFRPAVPG